jgi:hypothetical protein
MIMNRESLKMTRFINLTNHLKVNILGPDGDLIAIVRENGIKPARIRSHQIDICDYSGIPIKTTILDGIDNLPDPYPGVVYIVSYLVAVNANRIDVVSPNQFPGEYLSDPRTRDTLMVRSLQAFPTRSVG